MNHVPDGHAAGAGDFPAQGADDALGHGIVEAERIADGDRLLPDDEITGCARDDRGELGHVAVEPEHGDVLGFVLADEPGRALLLVGQSHLELHAVLDHVVIRDDMPPPVPDETGAAAAGDLFLGSEKEVADELDVGDVHDRIPRFVDHFDRVPFVLGQGSLLGVKEDGAAEKQEEGRGPRPPGGGWFLHSLLH